MMTSDDFIPLLKTPQEFFCLLARKMEYSTHFLIPWCTSITRPSPTLSFMPWGHCYLFCREVFLLPWVLSFLSWVFSFLKWKFCLFSFFTRLKTVVQTFLNWTPDEDKCVWSLFPSPQCNTNHIFFFFLIAQFLLFKRCRTQSIPRAGFLFRCQ